MRACITNVTNDQLVLTTGVTNVAILLHELFFRVVILAHHNIQLLRLGDELKLLEQRLLHVLNRNRPLQGISKAPQIICKLIVLTTNMYKLDFDSTSLTFFPDQITRVVKGWFSRGVRSVQHINYYLTITVYA